MVITGWLGTPPWLWKLSATPSYGTKFQDTWKFMKLWRKHHRIQNLEKIFGPRHFWGDSYTGHVRDLHIENMRFTLFQSELELIWCIGLSKLHIPKYPLKLSIIDVHMNHEHLSKLKRGRYRPPWTDVHIFLCLYKWDKAWKWYSSWRSRKRNIGILLADMGIMNKNWDLTNKTHGFEILKHQKMVIFHQTQGIVNPAVPWEPDWRVWGMAHCFRPLLFWKVDHFQWTQP